MSDRAELDLRAELARIDRDRAESQRFAAEIHKLTREARFRAEDWRMTPWIFGLTLVAGVIGGVIARHL